jgi:hypothetical protein
MKSSSTELAPETTMLFMKFAASPALVTVLLAVLMVSGSVSDEELSVEPKPLAKFNTSAPAIEDVRPTAASNNMNFFIFFSPFYVSFQIVEEPPSATHC